MPESPTMEKIMPETEDPENLEDPEDLPWKFLGICLEVARKLLDTLMRNGFSDWISPDVQAWIDITRESSVLSGGTLHGRHLSRAICTMEL